MPKIIDSLIRKSNKWRSLKFTHYKVTVVGYNDRNDASFGDSTKVTSTFKATEGEAPDYNSDQRIKEWGDTQDGDLVFHPPSGIVFNDFKSEGVRDRVTIETYGTKEFEVWSVDIDGFWGMASTTIYLRPI